MCHTFLQGGVTIPPARVGSSAVADLDDHGAAHLVGERLPLGVEQRQEPVDVTRQAPVMTGVTAEVPRFPLPPAEPPLPEFPLQQLVASPEEPSARPQASFPAHRLLLAAPTR